MRRRQEASSVDPTALWALAKTNGGWDGWLGIRGSLLPTIYTRVLLDGKLIGVLPGRPSEHAALLSAYAGRPDYASYVEKYGYNVANHAERYDAMFNGSSELEQRDWERLIAIVLVAQSAAALRGSTFGADIFEAAVNRLNEGMVFVNTAFVLRDFATDHTMKNASTYLYTAFHGDYVREGTTLCLGSTMIHEVLHVTSYESRYGNPDREASWIQGALMFGQRC